MKQCQRLKATIATLALVAMLRPPIAAFAADDANIVKLGPISGELVRLYAHSVVQEPSPSHEAKLDLLRKKVKYVFVLFQENRSFDYYFGTYPGANGLFSLPAVQTPGFVQKIVNTNGTVSTVSPFLIPETVKDVNGKTVRRTGKASCKPVSRRWHATAIQW